MLCASASVANVPLEFETVNGTITREAVEEAMAFPFSPTM